MEWSWEWLQGGVGCLAVMVVACMAQLVVDPSETSSTERNDVDEHSDTVDLAAVAASA